MLRSPHLSCMKLSPGGPYATHQSPIELNPPRIRRYIFDANKFICFYINCILKCDLKCVLQMCWSTVHKMCSFSNVGAIAVHTLIYQQCLHLLQISDYYKPLITGFNPMTKLHPTSCFKFKLQCCMEMLIFIFNCIGYVEISPMLTISPKPSYIYTVFIYHK